MSRTATFLHLTVTTFCLLAAIRDAHAVPVQLAITVDDLPIIHDMPQAGIPPIDTAARMLESLKRNGAPEVYGFVNGDKLAADPALLEVLHMWIRQGYKLGNHTYSHPHLNMIPASAYKTDIARNEPVLAQLSPDNSWRYFRYPYLDTGDTPEKEAEISRYLAEKNYLVANVTIDFRDWEWSEPYARCRLQGNADGIAFLQKTYLRAALNALKAKTRQAEIKYDRPIKHTLLLHMNAFTALMMDDLLSAYKAQGVQFIPLPDAVLDQLYAKYERKLRLTDVRLRKSLLLRLQAWHTSAPPTPAFSTARFSDALAQLCR